MNPNKLSFESENLVVDYISFKFQSFLDPASIGKIAFYLFESFGFNSILAKEDDPQEKKIFYDNRNQHKLSFRQFDYNPKIKSFWVGTKVSFAGQNAHHFYKQIKKHQFDWNIFDLTNTSLAQIDLHYFRESKITDQSEEVENFMKKCCQRIHAKAKRRKAKWGLESNGLVLRIGSRTRSKYYRVYQKLNGLQFELELKNQLVKSFQKSLVDNPIKEFEHELSKHFYYQSFGSLNLNS